MGGKEELGLGGKVDGDSLIMGLPESFGKRQEASGVTEGSFAYVLVLDKLFQRFSFSIAITESPGRPWDIAPHFAQPFVINHMVTLG